MDFSSIDDNRAVRLLTFSPSTPVIIDEPTSLVRSIYLDMEGSTHRHEGSRQTANFFDSSSDDEADGANTRAVAGQARSATNGKATGKCIDAFREASFLGGPLPPEYRSQSF
jgi:hypothetical protein